MQETPEDVELRAREERAQAAHLDSLRIKQLASMRRALYRSRAYAIIAAVACAGAAAQVGYLAWQHVMALGWELRPIVFAAIVVLAIYGAIFFTRRAIALTREARQSLHREPSTAPDFSTLGDGSQRSQNLERVEE